MSTDVTDDEEIRQLLARSRPYSIVCPVAADTPCGVIVFDLPIEETRTIMARDPCVQSGMMRFDAHQCQGFPGDPLPG